MTMPEKWLFLDTGFGTPAFNMALDEVLLMKQSNETMPPVLRFYGWEPAGLSLGYFQKTKGKIDVEGAKARGYGIVRRPTGGLAVLHDQELTYSVIIPESHEKMPNSVSQAYRVLSKGLLEGYKLLGIEPDLAIPMDLPGKSGTAVCFEEPSWYELVIRGRKAAGSSQTRQRGVILQHGSIPIEMDSEALFDLFVYPNEKVKERARKAFGEKAVSINEVLETKVTLDEVKAAFKKGFEIGLDLTLVDMDLDENLLKEARQLAKEKYENEAYTFSR
jgi:lipoyl(octanoyl) transferase